MNQDRVFRILESAEALLEQIGLRVTETEILDKAQKAGFQVAGNSIRIARQDTAAFFEKWKKASYVNTQRSSESADAFKGTFNEYCTNLLDYDMAAAVPFTVSSLIKATDTAAVICNDYSQKAGLVGQPSDVPADLQSFTRSLVSMICTPGDHPMEPASVASCDYMFELAAIGGQSIDRINAYMATPLGFGGETVKIVLKNACRLKSIKVTGMPALGCNAPLSIDSALCLSLAEGLGGAVVLERMTGHECDFLVQLHPFDFRSLNFVYGTPEALILSEIANDFNASLKGRDTRITRANMHVMAKEPGIQSAAEKSEVITWGARLGATTFNGLGALSLDEIYSPVQLVIDLELIEQGRRLMSGWPCEECMDVDEILSQIKEGLSGGYILTDTTLDNMDSAVWKSKLFTRRSLADANVKKEKNAYEIIV